MYGGAQEDRMQPQLSGCYMVVCMRPCMWSLTKKGRFQVQAGPDLADDAVLWRETAAPALQHQGGDKHRAHLARQRHLCDSTAAGLTAAHCGMLPQPSNEHG